MPEKTSRNADTGLMQNTILYFDCFAGVSGSMVVGALLNLGLPLDLLKNELDKLNLRDYSLKVENSSITHLNGTLFEVDFKEENHTRSFSDCRRLIEDSTLCSGVKKTSLSIFEHLAAAEARIHNVPIEDVHFHEIGAIDTIVDIVSAAVGFDHFGIAAFFCSPLPLSSGWISSNHGCLPLPAPATLELLEGIPTYPVRVNSELVTPTGAAIVKTLTCDFGQMPAMRIGKVGYGAGKYDLAELPNLLRLVTGTRGEVSEAKPVTIIEANIDDMNPEFYGFIMERLFEAGALDVSFSPLQMKKNRPGVLLRVMSPRGIRNVLMEMILSETTSLGVRYYGAERLALERSAGQVLTQWGPVGVKISKDLNGEYTSYPEYEECRAIAQKYGVPLKKVYREVIRHSEEDRSGKIPEREDRNKAIER